MAIFLKKVADLNGFSSTEVVFWTTHGRYFTSLDHDDPGVVSRTIRKITDYLEYDQRGYLIPDEQMVVTFNHADWGYVDSLIHRWELGEFVGFSLTAVLEMGIL